MTKEIQTEETARILCESTLSNDSYIIVNKKLAVELGTLSAILIGEFISLQKHYRNEKTLTDDGFFYRSQEDITAATGMSEYHQRQTRAELVKSGILEEKSEGLPKKLYYKVVYSKLGTRLISSSQHALLLEEKRVDINKNNNNKEIKEGKKKINARAALVDDSTILAVSGNAVAAESSTSREINELIDLFKNVNPSHTRFFGIPAQRDALKRLLMKFSFSQLQKAINILPDTNGRAYAPVITTPFELELKIAKLVAFVKREKIKSDTPNPKFRKIVNVNKK